MDNENIMRYLILGLFLSGCTISIQPSPSRFSKEEIIAIVQKLEANDKALATELAKIKFPEKTVEKK